MKKQGRPQETLKRQLFVEAFARGVSYTDIANALSVSRYTVMMWRREMGLPKRKAADGTYRWGIKKADASNG